MNSIVQQPAMASPEAIPQAAAQSKGADAETERPVSTQEPLLLVTPWYRPTIGGVVEVADRLFKQINASGREAHLMVCDQSAPPYIRPDAQTPRLWHSWIPGGVFCGMTMRKLAGMVHHALPALLDLRRFIIRHRIRTVMLLYPIEFSWPFLALAPLLDLRLIGSYHGNDVWKYDTYSRLGRWLCRKTLARTDVITVCAPHLRGKAQSLVPEKVLDVRLIANCVDTDYFTLAPPQFVRTDHRPTLLHVSNFAPKKRTGDIIQAFAQPCIPPEARLVMVGHGVDYDKAVGMAEELGVSGRVEFAGGQKDVRPFLWGADLFVLASEDEGAPLALLEAMACGLPYVSTPWGAAAQLPPGECGTVVPARSPEQLAVSLAKMLRDPQPLREMGRRGRQRAEADFAEQTYIQRHLDLVHDLENRPRRWLRRRLLSR